MVVQLEEGTLWWSKKGGGGGGGGSISLGGPKVLDTQVPTSLGIGGPISLLQRQ